MVISDALTHTPFAASSLLPLSQRHLTLHPLLCHHSHVFLHPSPLPSSPFSLTFFSPLFLSFFPSSITPFLTRSLSIHHFLPCPLMLRNAMTDNRLTLFYLVNGLPSARAFPIKPTLADTVGDLRDHIKAHQSPAFDDITSDQLNLWRVSIPDDNQDSAITIDVLDDKTALSNPRTRLSKLFPESPDDDTYIIVQRPPPSKVMQTSLSLIYVTWTCLHNDMVIVTSIRVINLHFHFTSYRSEKRPRRLCG